MRSRLTCAAVAGALALVLSACGSDDTTPTGAGSSGTEPTGGSSQSSEPATEETDSPEPTDDETRSSEPTDGETDSSEPVVIEITIENGQVTPVAERIEATVGQKIELHVDSDAVDEIHVHSQPEHEFDVEAEADQTFSFRIELPGQVEVELHELAETTVKLVVQP